MGGKGAAKLGTKVNKTTPDVPVTKSTTTVSKQSSKLAKQSDEYAALINSNKPWSWESFTDGASLTIKEKRAIKADAIARGLIPDIPYKVGTKYPDFEAAGLIEKLDELPPELWKQSDYKQFKWLDSRIPGGKPEGFTWHHSEIPGRMELVPFGPHNSINHSGGRSKGNWADAKR
ncbi:HNH endonuclease [Corallincola luteus]|uniref:HNH endonuclease n=2 Tax=Corallincola luteus TaxID=1775177 RepID=A0ABY2AT72_9GAMM|nr:HNH endonuclease [Corallincola luteus]